MAHPITSCILKHFVLCQSVDDWQRSRGTDGGRNGISGHKSGKIMNGVKRIYGRIKI